MRLLVGAVIDSRSSQNYFAFRVQRHTAKWLGAQLAPFAALHGHHEVMIEAERLTDRHIELDE